MNKKILIIDDEPDIHTLLNHYLEKIEGIEIINAYSGEEGLEIYKKLMEEGEKPSLVILDLNLSASDDITVIDLHRMGMGEKIDGVRTARELLKMDGNATIWGYTAWFGTEWAEKLKELGVEKILEKPTPFSDFAKMVKSFLKE
ncbi:MAG: response regulator [Thermoplasmata archaeon]|nr:response regulator [Thermoplasmata archaeon]